jgi:hypothetical protein
MSCCVAGLVVPYILSEHTAFIFKDLVVQEESPFFFWTACSLNIKALCVFETLRTTHLMPHCHTLEEVSPPYHHCENLETSMVQPYIKLNKC